MSELDAKIEHAKTILARAKAAYNPVKTFALVSGGNDSITTLHISRDQVDAVAHIVTGIGIPETSEFVRRVCSDWGLPLIELRTDPAVYRDIVLGPTRKGFPGPAFHYITYHRLKSQRLQELQRDHSKRKERLLFVSGVRSQESDRRMRNVGSVEMESPRGRLGRCCWANPIVHFSAADMLAYRVQFDLPVNPVWQVLHKSGECLCGCFAKPGELEEIEQWYPATGAYIRGLETEAKAMGKEYPNWGFCARPEKARPIRGPQCEECQLSLFAA